MISTNDNQEEPSSTIPSELETSSSLSLSSNLTDDTRIEQQDLNDTIIFNTITSGTDDRNSFSDWILGIIGGNRPTEKPIQLDPPEICEPCS